MGAGYLRPFEGYDSKEIYGFFLRHHQDRWAATYNENGIGALKRVNREHPFDVIKIIKGNKSCLRSNTSVPLVKRGRYIIKRYSTGRVEGDTRAFSR